MTREVVTVLGTGAPGWEDGAAERFHEPGSVSVAGRLLHVADTDNHVIRLGDLGTGQVRLASTGPAVLPADSNVRTVSGPGYPVTLEFPVDFAAREARLQVDAVVYYCREVRAEQRPVTDSRERRR
ncbi:MAG: hypothetical protein H3C53_11150 [Trueperaceae bacterium]|nr:hypothetical protein [Trueperaceae bacterium]